MHSRASRSAGRGQRPARGYRIPKCWRPPSSAPGEKPERGAAHRKRGDGVGRKKRWRGGRKPPFKKIPFAADGRPAPHSASAKAQPCACAKATAAPGAPSACHAEALAEAGPEARISIAAIIQHTDRIRPGSGAEGQELNSPARRPPQTGTWPCPKQQPGVLLARAIVILASADRYEQ